MRRLNRRRRNRKKTIPSCPLFPSLERVFTLICSASTIIILRRTRHLRKETCIRNEKKNISNPKCIVLFVRTSCWTSQSFFLSVFFNFSFTSGTRSMAAISPLGFLQKRVSLIQNKMLLEEEMAQRERGVFLRKNSVEFPKKKKASKRERA